LFPRALQLSLSSNNEPVRWYIALRPPHSTPCLQTLKAVSYSSYRQPEKLRYFSSTDARFSTTSERPIGRPREIAQGLKNSCIEPLLAVCLNRRICPCNRTDQGRNCDAKCLPMLNDPRPSCVHVTLLLHSPYTPCPMVPSAAQWSMLAIRR